MQKVLKTIPDYKRVSTSFTGVKRVTVPNQSMTLQEILQRFVRRESLPVMKEGTYQTGYGDLEKIQNMDITEKMEVVDKIKIFLKKGKKMEEERAKGEQDKTQAPPPPPQPPAPPEPPTPPKA